MRRLKGRPLMLVLLGLALSFSLALAIVAVNPFEPEHSSPTFVDHDRRTTAIAARRGLEAAWRTGNRTAIAMAEEAIHQQMLSRLNEDQRRAAESAPPEADVPKGTKVYIADDVPDAIVERCRALVRERGHDQLCELIILNAEGKIRSGAYSAEQVNEVLEGEAAGVTASKHPPHR